MQLRKNYADIRLSGYVLMRKRTRYSLLLMLALVAALVVAVLRKTAPPEVARLLPESDAIVYVNLKPLRAATHFDRTP